MRALAEFFTALPAQLIHVATYAAGHPAVCAGAAVCGAGVAAAFVVNVRSWRKGN